MIHRQVAVHNISPDKHGQKLWSQTVHKKVQKQSSRVFSSYLALTPIKLAAPTEANSALMCDMLTALGKPATIDMDIKMDAEVSSDSFLLRRVFTGFRRKIQLARDKCSNYFFNQLGLQARKAGKSKLL